MNDKTIAVFGATGSQGGSVVRHLKDQTDFRVRALTRQPDAYNGPADEAVHIDLDDIATFPDALSGAHGVFLVTNFWEPGTDEVKQGGAAVQAAAQAGVHHFIWSSLPNVEQISGGTWDVPHFTNKARVDPIVRDAGFPVHTIVQAPFYMQNLVGMMAPQPMQDGSKGWTLPIDPDAKVIHMGDINEIGSLVAGAFDNPAASNGEILSMAGGIYSFADVIKAYSHASGEDLGFQQVPLDVFAGFFPQASEIGQMLGYFEDYTYMGPDAEPRLLKARNIAKAPFTSLDKWLSSTLGQAK